MNHKKKKPQNTTTTTTIVKTTRIGTVTDTQDTAPHTEQGYVNRVLGTVIDKVTPTTPTTNLL